MNKEYGTFPDPDTVRFERLLPGPPERIWAFLTESDKKAQWLSAGNVEPKVGGKVTHEFFHPNLSKEEDPLPEKYADLKDGDTGHGEVTAWDPYRLLSYTWVEENGDSEVTFELIPKENDMVLLILTHRNLGDDLDMLSGVGAGWHTHLGILEDRLKGKEPQAFWKIHMPLEKEYAETLRKNRDNRAKS